MSIIEFASYLEGRRVLIRDSKSQNPKRKSPKANKHRIDEVKVCQMLALLKERLGGVEIKPTLTVVGAGPKRKIIGSLEASSPHKIVPRS